jgi:hypothetical protein
MLKRPKRNTNQVLLLGLTCAILAACGARPTSTPDQGTIDIETEEQAIYTAVFEELYGEPQMYVIMSDTAVSIQGVEGMDAALETIGAQMTGVDEETAASFRDRNEASFPVPANMDLDLPYVLLTSTEMDQIFDINTSSWDVFYTRYPNSPGITTISRIGFNTDYTQALVYTGTMSHWLAGAGFYIFLEKSSGEWLVMTKVMAWIS